MFAAIDTTHASDTMEAIMERTDGTFTHTRERSTPQPARAVYERPRLQRRDALLLVTLASGNECVFDPPGSC